MAIPFQQQDTVAPCGVIQACAPVAPAADADARLAEKSGTPGTTELACNVAAGSSELCYADELAIADDDSLDAGDLTARLNITSAQNNLTLEEIYVCRLNSSCTSQETLGSVTGLGTDVSAGGVFSQVVSLSAASAHNPGDVVYIAYVLANSHSMTSRSVAITPDQVIDTPWAAGSTTESISATLAGTSLDSAAGSLTESLTATLPGTSLDSAPASLTSALSATLVGTSADTAAPRVAEALSATLVGVSSDGGVVQVSTPPSGTVIIHRFQPSGWVHPAFASGDFPNEPDNFSLVAEYGGDVLPLGSNNDRLCSVCDAEGDCTTDPAMTKGCITSDGDAHSLSLVQDTDHPIEGEDTVTRMTFGDGMTGGGSPNWIIMFGPHPENLTMWCASAARPNGFELEELYYSLHLRLVSGPGDGTWEYKPFLKYPGRIGVAEDTSNAFGNQIIMNTDGDGSAGFLTDFSLGIGQQGPASVPPEDRMGGGTAVGTERVQVGQWTQIEVWCKLNTINASSYNLDGACKVWVNDVLSIDRSGFAWRSDTESRGFYATMIDPTWGKPEDTKTRDDYIHYGHRRISGIELAGVNN